jgi:hypothetical protein
MDAKTILMLASAGIILLLGLVHLLYTFWRAKLLPRDPSLVESMKAVPLVITRETSVWKAWLGFNASQTWPQSCLEWFRPTSPLLTQLSCTAQFTCS